MNPLKTSNKLGFFKNQFQKRTLSMNVSNISRMTFLYVASSVYSKSKYVFGKKTKSLSKIASTKQRQLLKIVRASLEQE